MNMALGRRAPGVGASVRRALVLALVATSSPAGADVILNSTLFHITLAGTFPPRPSCIIDRDVHLLSGTVTAATGGTVRVTVVNKTMPDYDLVFGPSISDRGFIVHNVTAMLPCNATAMTVVPGYAGCEDPATGGRDVCNSITFEDDPSPDVPPHNHWLLSIGVNPPLPPVQCGDLHDQGSCESNSCSWCTSSDGLHALCFTEGHAPNSTAGWTCGAHAVG